MKRVAAGLLMMGLVVAVAHAAPAPSPGVSGCIDLVVSNMMGCVPYMTAGGGSPTPPPGKACCDGVTAVLKKDAQCVCVAIASAPDYGVAVNMTRAAALPGLCHLTNPPELEKLCSGSQNKTAPAPAATEPHHAAPALTTTGGSSSPIAASCVLMAALALLHLPAFI